MLRSSRMRYVNDLPIYAAVDAAAVTDLRQGSLGNRDTR